MPKDSFLPTDIPEPSSFEEAMLALEQLVGQMESGELPLEILVSAYQRGSQLIKYCSHQLDKVESQVKVLDGEMLKPFNEMETNE